MSQLRKNPAKRVSVRVPDIAIYERYKGRSFDGKREFEIFDYALRTKRNILIEGPTGDGKTMAGMAWAAKHGKNYFSVPCNVGIDPAQLFGQWIPTADGGVEWVDGGLTKVVREGGLLVINEINAMPAKVGMVIFSLLDYRRCITLTQHGDEVVEAHPDLLIIADCNPGYAGTSALNAALRNRFPIQLFWDYDSEVEEKLVPSKTLREDIAQGLRQQFREGKIFTPCSTNMLMEFVEFGTEFSLDFAITNFINHFDEQDRQAVLMVFETFRANLVAEFAELKDKGPDNPGGDHVVFRDPEWIYSFPGSLAASVRVAG